MEKADTEHFFAALKGFLAVHTRTHVNMRAFKSHALILIMPGSSEMKALICIPVQQLLPEFKTERLEAGPVKVLHCLCLQRWQNGK